MSDINFIENAITNKYVDSINDYNYSGLTVNDLLITDNIRYMSDDSLSGLNVTGRVKYDGTESEFFSKVDNYDIIDKFDIEFESDNSAVFTLRSDNASYELSRVYGNRLSIKDFYVIPETYNNLPVRSIGDQAFSDCRDLETVLISNNLQTISSKDSIDGAFGSCYSLKSVRVKSNSQLTTINRNSFKDCPIEDIVIPSSVTSIGFHAFSKSKSNCKVVYRGSLTQWCNIKFGGTGSNPIGELYIDGKLLEGDIVIPSGVTDLFFVFESYQYITGITLPSTLKSVNINGCSNLKSVKFSDYSQYSSTTTIGGLSRSSIEEIIIPSSVTSIGNWAFEGCSKLTKVVLYSDSKLTTLGSGVFSGCKKLSSINLPNTVVEIGLYSFEDTELYNNYPDGLVYISNVLYKYKGVMPSGFVANVKEGTTYITAECCMSQLNLVSLSIPSSCNIIDSYAFAGCTNLRYLSILGSEEISLSAFEGSSITSLDLPEGLVRLDNDVFRSCTKLCRVSLPSTLTDVGKDTFRNCHRLVEVYNLSSLNITKGSDSYGCVGLYALDIYTSLDTPSKLSTDEDGYILRTDGEEITLIGYSGTETELTLPNDITAINQYALYSNDNITSITIPNSVTSIGDYAFEGSSLEYIIYYGTESQWNSITKGSNWDSATGNYEIIYDSF